MLKNIAVFISGSGTNLQTLIDESKKSKLFKIVLVVSSTKKAFGLQRAQKNNIPTIINDKNFAPSQLIKELKNSKVDLIVLAGYLSILKGDLLKQYKNKIINIHPSLIPSFCGKGMYGIHVHEAVINSGVKYTGATVHFVNEGIDTGAIIDQVSIKVNSKDTPNSLQKRLLKYEHKLLVSSLKKILINNYKIINNKIIWG